MIVRCIHCQVDVASVEDRPALSAHAMTCERSPVVQALAAARREIVELLDRAIASADRVLELETAAREAVTTWQVALDFSAGDRHHAAMIALAGAVGIKVATAAPVDALVLGASGARVARIERVTSHEQAIALYGRGSGVAEAFEPGGLVERASQQAVIIIDRAAAPVEPVDLEQLDDQDDSVRCDARTADGTICSSAENKTGQVCERWRATGKHLTVAEIREDDDDDDDVLSAGVALGVALSEDECTCARRRADRVEHIGPCQWCGRPVR